MFYFIYKNFTVKVLISVANYRNAHRFETSEKLASVIANWESLLIDASVGVWVEWGRDEASTGGKLPRRGGWIGSASGGGGRNRLSGGVTSSIFQD